MQTLNRTPTLGVHHNGDGGHHAGDGSNHVGDVGDHRDGGGGADDADHRDADVAGQLLESGDLVLLVPHGMHKIADLMHIRLLDTRFQMHLDPYIQYNTSAHSEKRAR